MADSKNLSREGSILIYKTSILKTDSRKAPLKGCNQYIFVFIVAME